MGFQTPIRGRGFTIRDYKVLPFVEAQFLFAAFCCQFFFVLPTRRFSHRPIGPFAGAAEILEVDVKSTGELHIEGPRLNGGPETLESFRYLCSECFPKCSGR